MNSCQVHLMTSNQLQQQCWRKNKTISIRVHTNSNFFIHWV